MEKKDLDELDNVIKSLESLEQACEDISKAFGDIADSYDRMIKDIERKRRRDNIFVCCCIAILIIIYIGLFYLRTII